MAVLFFFLAFAFRASTQQTTAPQAGGSKVFARAETLQGSNIVNSPMGRTVARSKAWSST
jgi:hypothetical protein